MTDISSYECPGCDFNNTSEFIIDFHKNTCFVGYLAENNIFMNKEKVENFIKILTNYNYFNAYFPSKNGKYEKNENVRKYFIYIDAKKLTGRDDFVKYVSNLTYLDLNTAYKISELYNHFTKIVENYIMHNF